MELYGLESATVVPVYVEDQDLLRTGRPQVRPAAGSEEAPADGDVIGISWGPHDGILCENAGRLL